jgi:hypothetical protein
MELDTVVEALARVVEPYVGATMARSALKVHGQKLGLDGAPLTAAQVEALITRVGSGLNVFLGREKSEVVVGELKKAAAGLR